MLILVEKKTSRREIARGSDRNELALIAQCEFLHRNVIHHLVNDGLCEIDGETVLEIEEEPT